MCIVFANCYWRIPIVDVGYIGSMFVMAFVSEHNVSCLLQVVHNCHNTTMDMFHSMAAKRIGLFIGQKISMFTISAL